MGIYIKNMEMPKQGRTTIQIGSDGAVYFVDKCLIFKEKYEANYSAIAIKAPRSRLIEEPKILSYCGLAKISPYDFIGTAKYFFDQIKAMPTIIEAEVKQ